MDTQRIANLVKVFRTAHGLSQEALGERFQMSGAYVSRLENRQVKEPRRSDMMRLAQVMEISLGELTGELDHMIIERLGEFENDVELRAFAVGLMSKLRNKRPETRRLAMAFINSIADAETDAPENASMG